MRYTFAKSVVKEMMMPDLPEGTITFFLTDVEGSTSLWERERDAMRAAMTRHDEMAEDCVTRFGGHLLKKRGEGDALFCVFAGAQNAVACALAWQQELGREVWATSKPLRVRIALHTGEADLRDGDYYGQTVNRTARLRGIGHGGQTLLSHLTAELASSSLPQDASLQNCGWHHLKDLQEPEQVFQLMHPALPAEFPPLKSLNPEKNNLPRQLSSFIGREREMQEVKARLASSRLLTLTGVGGTGKTRLSLQVAADLADEFPDGIWLIELAPITDPALVTQTLARVLNITEEVGKPLVQTLTETLKSRRLLVLLDNCEHLLATCTNVAHALLRGTSDVKILATSREPLNVPGEAIYPIPTLSLPNPKDKQGQEHLEQSEAVQLFLARATAAHPQFALTSQNARAVAQICRRLDGIPLALELAAPRLRVLSPELMAQRLDDRFRLLTGGSRTGLSHHQTLRALVDWSYEPLPDAEKTLFNRLSVFAGGCTLEAVEQVCAGGVVEEWEIFDLLTHLVDKSLILAEHTEEGATRYRLLETLRQYGREKLEEAGEVTAMQAKHAAWFYNVIKEAEQKLRSPARTEWARNLEADHDNLRAALEWLQSQPEHIETCLNMTGTLAYFWHIGNFIIEGRERVSKTLALADTPPETAALANALIGDGTLCLRQGDFGQAIRQFERALTIWRNIGDKTRIASVLSNLGLAQAEQGDFEQGRQNLEESLTLQRELKDQWNIANCLNNLGLLEWNRGHYAKAVAYYEECRTLRRVLKDDNGLAATLHNLCLILMIQGNFAEARMQEEESHALYQKLGDKNGMAYTVHSLGDLAYWLSDYPTAQQHYEAGMELFQQIGDRWGICATYLRLGDIARRTAQHAHALLCYQTGWEITQEMQEKRLAAECLEGMAGLLASRQQFADAARLLGAAERLREELGSEREAHDAQNFQEIVAAVSTQLGDQSYVALLIEGGQLSAENLTFLLLKQE